MRCSPVVLCLLASQAAGGPFDGVWSPDPARCVVEYDPERVIIRDDVLLVQEERCSLSQPTPALSPVGAVVYFVQCQGLDYTHSSRAALLLTPDDHLVIVAMSTNGQTVYARCD